MIRRTKLSTITSTLGARIATGGLLLAALCVLPGFNPRIAAGASTRQQGTQTQTIFASNGHGNRTTRSVMISGRWTLHWSFSCRGGRGRFQVSAYRHGGRAPLARITKKGVTGRGSLHVFAGGTVHLVIRTACSWRVTVTGTVRSTPSPTPAPTSTPAPSPTASAAPTSTSDLAIHVDGARLTNAQGQPIRLIGVNVPGSAQCIPTGPHTPPGIFAFPSATQTATAVAGWHADAVRITLNEDCWLGINRGEPTYTGPAYRTAVTSFVADLNASGIYVILDLHDNAPGGNASTSQQVMADADHALDYWTSVANTFKSHPAVIFEPYNEPHITVQNAQTSNPWQCWRDGCTVDELDQYHNTPIPGAQPWHAAGMQSLVDAIRATGATNPILIDGLNWAQDLTQLLRYLPSDPQHQLIADYHNYMSPGSKNAPAYWDTVIAPIAAQLPVVTSEFGEKDCGSTYLTEYMQWADEHDISYFPWVWMTWDCGAMGLVSDWDGTPSVYGQPIFDHFHRERFTTG